MSKKLGLGIIGAGWMADMASEEIVKLNTVQLTAVCARHKEKAQAFADKYGIANAFGSVDELLACDDVDAVYIATLNDTHYEMGVKAIEAGKAAIIEKPFTMNADEARKLTTLAAEKGVFVMEAMWTRFFPTFNYVKLLVDSGKIGKLKSIELNMSLKMDKKANARVYAKEHGGGVLVDIGVYAVNFVQMLAGAKPVSVTNKLGFEDTEVDMTDEIIYNYESGLKAKVEVSGMDNIPGYTVIKGSEGSIEFEGGLMAGILRIKAGEEETFIDLGTERFRYPYYFQFEHFARCIAEGRKESFINSIEDTITVMEMMDDARHDGGYYFIGE